MARRAIRENNVKDILSSNWYDYFGESFIYNFRSVKITPKTDFDKVEKIYGWLNELPLVVKPDMLFGKRGVLGLVLYNLHSRPFIPMKSLQHPSSYIKSIK